MTDAPKTSTLEWNPTYRLVPSRYPPVGVFDRVANADDLDVIFAIEAVTNPRLRDEIGEIRLVARNDRVVGTGSSVVMAAFCHLNPNGSRFSDGTWGVYYGASSLEVAVAEVSHHRANFLRATAQLPLDIDMRCYVGHVTKPLHDLRPKTWSKMHVLDDYTAPQSLARRLRVANAWGVVYRSVRAPGGECVGVFRPNGVDLPVKQGGHVSLCWDGFRIRDWYKKSNTTPLTIVPKL